MKFTLTMTKTVTNITPYESGTCNDELRVKMVSVNQRSGPLF